MSPERGAPAWVAGAASRRALALAFLLAHAPVLSSTLEDIDSVNFALGLRHFDVAEHRPHPPGYPIYIALGKAAVFLAGNVSGLMPRSALEARAMAWLSALFGALAVPLLYRLFASLTRARLRADASARQAGDDRIGPPWRRIDVKALAATLLTVTCPLFWYMAARPMSDTVGLAAALAAQVCLALAWWRQQPTQMAQMAQMRGGDRRLTPEMMAASGRMIVLGALLAGLSIGFRSQTMWLTLPLLVGVLVDRIGRGVAGALLGSTITFGIGALAWGIPLLVANGGPGRYLAALGSQAGEDFAGVEMLYLNPTPRAAAFAMLRTFVYPWDSTWLAIIVLILAAMGAAGLLARDRRTLVAVGLLSLPYLAFHLLFQDTTYVRYALPLVPIVALLAVRGAAVAGEYAAAVAAVALAVWSLAIAVPALATYASEASPVRRALDAMRAEVDRSGQPGALAMHQSFRRPLEAEEVPITRVLPSLRRQEWLETVRYWREGNVAPVWMLADPRRTELALIDPHSRRDATPFSWAFRSLSTIGGMRPSDVTWYRLPAPGWFAEEGWSLTPETAGMARLMGRGPHLGPITAWVRRRGEATRVMIGGRNLGPDVGPDATFTLRVDGREHVSWDVEPGFFLRVFELPTGALAGEDALARLTIESGPIAKGGPPTAVEQFDLQDEGSTMWGFGEGWHEAELDAARGPWRWTSERAVLIVDGPPTPLVLRMRVESPLRYFDAPQRVQITANGRLLREVTFSDERTEIAVDLPAEAVSAPGGIAVQTDQTFVPAERNGGPDHRRLGLRVLALELSPLPGVS